jgi:hypothetical protein
LVYMVGISAACAGEEEKVTAVSENIISVYMIVAEKCFIKKVNHITPTVSRHFFTLGLNIWLIQLSREVSMLW